VPYASQAALAAKSRHHSIAGAQFASDNPAKRAFKQKKEGRIPL